MSMCKDNWYTPVFYEGELFAALQPKRMICKDETGAVVEGESSSASVEFALTMMIQLYLGSLIILFILYRSCSRQKTDAFRLVWIYLFCTVFVALSMNFGVGTGGFTRLIAYGVMVHNMAEWFIISRIWFGCAAINALPALCYLITFVIFITASPLVVLWFVGMFQGGVCDYILVYSTMYLTSWTDKQAKIGNIKTRRKYMCAGFFGALAHLLSIQPLFFGMATAYSPLMYLTTIFILPTFVLYTYWASSGSNKVNIVAPGDRDEILDNASDDEMDFERVVKQYSMDTELQRVDNDENGALMGGDDNERKNDIEDDGKPKKYKDVLIDVVNRGLTNIDPKLKTTRNIVFIAAFFSSLINSIICFMSPCYLDLSYLNNCN